MLIISTNLLGSHKIDIMMDRTLAIQAAVNEARQAIGFWLPEKAMRNIRRTMPYRLPPTRKRCCT